MRISRRKFLATTTAAVAGAPLMGFGGRRRFTGGIIGANSKLGHAMRDGRFSSPSESAETGIVIIGGGIGGLAAARRLHNRGFTDFRLLELESHSGGNAVSGRNEVSAFPWGAHYVPIAGSDSTEVVSLFEELDVITGRDSAGVPIYAEEYLCADPMERLFIHGRWQEGFIPQLGVTAADRRTIDSFLAEMQRLKLARGSDGRRAFTIPLDKSSRDAAFTDLDRITMSDYLRNNGWADCAPLSWYVNYCCRDDYGAGMDKVSAWAGVHYFASRNGRAANGPDYSVVTWPEGNGWFVQRMRSSISKQIQNSCAVWNVDSDGKRLLVDYFDAVKQKSVRLRAQGVIWAAPRFVAQRAIRQLREQPPNSQPPVYSPWMVANLSLDAMPGGLGMQLAWDNVFYDSNSLGYVVATHQHFDPVPQKTVLTYYQPLDDAEPSIARQNAVSKSYDAWSDAILADLGQAHPEITRHVTNLDVWLWGHAMVRPVPGFIWGQARAQMQEPLGNIVFAHSDLSGISIFEEAYTRGVKTTDDLVERIANAKT